MRTLPLFLLIILIQFSSSTLAWGWDGHKFICALAEKQFSLKAKAMVDQLLIDGEKLEGGVLAFPESCLWADEVRNSTRRNSYEEHFINVPRDATQVDLVQDCAPVNCIASGVQRSLHYLSSEAIGERSITRRAAALRFLGHYVGDLHQPLHISNFDDLGGNLIKVNWYDKPSNLHAIWDYEMLNTMGITYPESLAFLATVKPGGAPGSVLSWMNESLHLARSHAYSDGSSRIIKNGETLGDAYLNRNKPIVLQRLALAAKRLASLINRIADGETPVAFVLTAAP